MSQRLLWRPGQGSEGATSSPGGPSDGAFHSRQPFFGQPSE